MTVQAEHKLDTKKKLQAPNPGMVAEKTMAGAIVIDVNTIPWTEFPMEGVSFRLLRVDEQNGGCTLMFKTLATAPPSPIHKHLGHLETYNIYGNWGYGESRVGPDTYMYEPAGTIHAPWFVGEELLLFAIMRGPIGGLDDDGNVNSIVDGDLLYQLAAANNAVGHLPLVPPLI
jgi:hypothetical protein